MHNPMRGVVTSHYDLKRRHPVFKTEQPHRGIDIATPGVAAGGIIRAAYAGRVAAVEDRWRDLGFNWGCIWGRSGNGILIRNDDGEHQYYGHPEAVYVRPGQWVEEGQVIGVEGASGRVTGPHLHFEVHEWASGPGNNWTKTRDPRLDFRAAGITPGVDSASIHHASVTTTEREWSDMATKAEIREAFEEALAPMKADLATIKQSTSTRYVDVLTYGGKATRVTPAEAIEQAHTRLRNIEGKVDAIAAPDVPTDGEAA